MKRLMLSLVVIAVFTMSNSVNAQKTATTNKTTTKTIRTSEKEIEEIIHKGITYYIFNGTWHTKMKNRYVLRNAPKGAKIDFKPAGGEYVTMHGKKYYKCKGIFYKQHKDSLYEVVRI
jgi:hypothetical protein